MNAAGVTPVKPVRGVPDGEPSAAGVGTGLALLVVLRRLSVVFAVFVVVVAGVMLAGRFLKKADEPWYSADLAQARQALHADPKNEALKGPVRELDRELRRGYFRNLERNRWGAWLLLGGGMAWVLSARWAAAVAGRGVVRGPWEAPDREATRRKAARTLAVVGGVSAVLMLAAGLAAGVRLPRVAVPVAVAGGGAGGAPEAEVAPMAGAPDPALLARQWPRFRGYDGGARVEAAGIPLTWNVKTGEGVRWKASVPLKGYSSPVVWENRVFVTGGNREQRRVFAFDASSGEAVWVRSLTPSNAVEEAIVPPDLSGQAASTPAVDAERVYAVFATGELGALSHAGDLVWSRRLDVSENGYGYAASLVAWGDRLLVQVDLATAEDGKSVLLALDARTGKESWRARRPVGAGWTTPILAEHVGRMQVVTAGDPWLMGHDLADGSEIWRARVLGGELAPSPVHDRGRIIATSPGHAFLAVRMDGSGDVTGTHVVWKLEEEVPDVPTPTVSGELLFSAGTDGTVICRDAATGEKLWDHAFEWEVQASPLAVGGRIYLFGQPGNVAVFEAGRAYVGLADFEMGEDIYATPAVAGDLLVIRTDKNLYGIGGRSGGSDAKASGPAVPAGGSPAAAGEVEASHGG